MKEKLPVSGDTRFEWFTVVTSQQIHSSVWPERAADWDLQHVYNIWTWRWHHDVTQPYRQTELDPVRYHRRSTGGPAQPLCAALCTPAVWRWWWGGEDEEIQQTQLEHAPQADLGHTPYLSCTDMWVECVVHTVWTGTRHKNNQSSVCGSAAEPAHREHKAHEHCKKMHESFCPSVCRHSRWSANEMTVSKLTCFQSKCFISWNFSSKNKKESSCRVSVWRHNS